MSESLFSDLWHRVAATKPALRPEVRLVRQQVRGERWFVLVAETHGRQVRLNETAYQFVGRCDGERTVQAIWEALLDRLGNDAPTQDEVIAALSELERQEFLASDGPVDAEALIRRREEREAQGKTQRFVNPLALRVPCGDPSGWLARVPRLPRLLFNRATLVLWLVTAIGVMLAATTQWHALSLHAAQYLGTPRHLVLAWLIFPLLKALHEAAHALAVRRWGGEVREIGFTLFVLVPAPYVDASAAAAFPDRYQRFTVGAAGMMAELAVAAVAMLVWCNVEPGLLRDAAFVTLFLAGVSSLLFNGNPLLRFDAYFILCDALDLPNLATRSRTWWRTLFTRALGGGRAAPPMTPAAGEAKWLFAYAPASLVAQIVISWLLILWLAGKSTLLAGLAFAILFFLLIGKPLWGTLRSIWSSAAPTGGHARAFSATAAAGCVALLVVCALPLPFYTVAQGVVWAPEQARVRAGTDGFVAEIPVRDGDWVAAGQLVIVLDDPALLTEKVRLGNRLEQLGASRYSAMLASPEKARQIEEETARTEAELARIDQRIAALEVRAQTEGRLSMPDSRDLLGAFVKQGSTLAHVIERTDVTVRAAVPEYDAALLREAVALVEVRLAGASGPRAAERVRDVPAATFELPSPALGDRGGGVHPTDPEDKDGLRTRQPVVLVDLKLPSQPLERIGSTAWVRFDHGFQPLAQRWMRQLRQVLLQHAHPAG